jgi:hypothetical protein
VLYFVWPLKYLTKKTPAPTKPATVILIKVKSCNALWHMLLGYVRSYLKSVLRHKFLISVTYHQAIIYLREQGCEDPWAHFEAKRDTRAKTFGRHWYRAMVECWLAGGSGRNS